MSDDYSEHRLRDAQKKKKNTVTEPALDLSNLIAAEVKQKGAEVVGSLLCRALIQIAHDGDNDFNYSAETGEVSIQRKFIPKYLKS